MALPKLMSKQTKQNDIPKGWKKVKLSELLVEVNERNRERAELPVLSVTNSRGFVLQSEQFARNLHSKNTSNYKIVSKEQFAYNPARINVGSIALLRKWEKGLLSPMYVVFGTKSELLNDYLHYYIQSPRFSVQVSNNTAGSVRKSLNFNAFEHFDYVYPESKPEQKKIVEVLASVDEEIEKTKEVIKTTEKLKKGLMQHLFTRGIGHAKFKPTELGEIPESWEVRTLQKLLDKKFVVSHLDGNHGGLYPRTTEFVQQGVPYLSANCIENGVINFSKAKFLTEQRAGKFVKGVAKDGDILFAHNATVGPVAKLNTDLDYVILSTTLTYYRTDENYLKSEYLLYFLQSPLFVNQYEKVMSQSTRNQVPITMQRKFLHALPPVYEQKEIAGVLSAVDEKIAVNKKLLAKQTELKKGLMQDLLSGVKRVKV